MAIRARSDNLSLDHPVVETATAAPLAPVAPVVDFSELWAHREALRHACYRLVGNAATAEDLVQDTYVRALTAGAHLERRTSMAPWLATVARRRTIDELRSRQRMTLVEALPERVGRSHAFDDPAHQVVNQELVEGLRAALAELSPRERQLLLRQVSHGLSLAELAAEESTSVASVRSVLARARQKLRMSLERSGALGGLPLARLVGSWRNRMQRWAMEMESAMPIVTGAGWQVGQIVAAVVVVLASLATGPRPLWGPGPETTVVANASHALGEASPSPHGARASVSPPGAGAPSASGPSGTNGAASSAVPYLSLDVPSIPEGADQPEQAQIHSFSTSDDESVILASASANSIDPLAIYKSTDRGASWVRLTATGFQGGRLLLPPSFPQDPRIFAVRGTGLQISEDGGQSFVKGVPSGGDAVLSPDFATGDERIFLAGPPPMSYRLDDAAPVPMHAVPPTVGPGGIAIGPDWDTDQELLIGTTMPSGTVHNRPAVFSCTPAGCTQRAVLTYGSGPPRILTSGAEPDRVVAWAGAGVFVSTDGGMTFARRSLPAGFSFASVSQDATGRLYLSGGQGNAASGLYVSDDDGSTWSPLGVGSLVESGTMTVTRLADGRLLAALLGHGGVACSVDDGATWATRCPSA